MYKQHANARSKIGVCAGYVGFLEVPSAWLGDRSARTAIDESRPLYETRCAGSAEPPVRRRDHTGSQALPVVVGCAAPPHGHAFPERVGRRAGCGSQAKRKGVAENWWGLHRRTFLRSRRLWGMYTKMLFGCLPACGISQKILFGCFSPCRDVHKRSVWMEPGMRGWARRRCLAESYKRGWEQT